MIRFLLAPAQILLFFACPMAASHAENYALTFIGQQTIPHHTNYQNTVVGGLSSLDYNPETDRFVTVSDDRSAKSPARFYHLMLDYDGQGFRSWTLTDVRFIKQPNGRNFPKPRLLGKSAVDPEALKFSPARNSYFWTSEGDARHGVDPFIREMDLQGNHLRDFTLPVKYKTLKYKTKGNNRGVRNNRAFESLTLNRDHATITVSLESPLVQDGAAANGQHGAPVRFLQLNIKSGQPTREYVYRVEPVQKEILPFGISSVNGVVDILALTKDKYMVMERSFSAGAGLSVRLYLADFTEATDVLAHDSLKGITYHPAKKTLLLDLGTLGLAVDNMEGMSFGRPLTDGHRSLILISDDNFRAAQTTQILVFAVGRP